MILLFHTQALLKSQTECSYTHIILDEIHERSTEIDFALFITRKLAVTFPDLKIILVSATLHESLFTPYFRNKLGHDKVADPYFMGIKPFPVKVLFIDHLDQLVSTKKDKEQHAAMSQLQVLARKVENNAAQLLPYAPKVTPFTEEVCMNLIISQLSPGDAVLIFLSELGDINEFCNNLHKKLERFGVRHRYRLFIFHSQLQSEDQDEAFQKPLKGTANIIVTNRGSESSLTIPNLRLVINFGINKEMIYNSAKRVSEVSPQWCSRASCIQREGRVGRVSEGTAVHLFTKEFYETLPDFGPPEIIRVPLAKTFLRAKEIGPQLGIPLPSHLLSMVIEPPSFVQFSTALHDLAEYGAIAHNPQHKISEEADVTLLGKFSLSLPLDLNLCRLVLLGILFGCPLDGIVIAAATAMYQDVFSMPMKVIMNDLHRFCHSLITSTLSRMRYDDGCYSNPIMILNMFIDWLKYRNENPHASRRDLATNFQKAVRPARLLHLEDFVRDIARCVANCICQDTVLYSELQTLSQISMKNKGEPVFGEFPSQPGRKSNAGLLHFCNNCVILKALITAAAPDEILCGERACESSSPYSRTFAQKCMKVIENECFSLSHTLCMDLSKLDEEQMQETDETVFEKLFKNFPNEFQLSVESKVVKDIAVLHFQSDPSLVLTKTAQSCTPRQRKSSTADISEIPPEVNFFWRFGEQMTLWEIDEVDALFPAPSHPCALMWYRFDESKSKVNTVSLNFRNPTGFVCQYDRPSQPYFAVATGAFLSGGNILAPRLTVLPCMPTSLMMVLAFQHSTSTIEFLVNKTTIKGIKLNSVEIPCTDIERYISKDEIGVINQLRRAISNAMALPLNNGCIPLYDPAITSIPRLLQDLLSSCKPNISKSTTSNLQTLSMDDRQPGVVWEMITPGKSLKDQSTLKFSYYAEFKCSLLDSKPYTVKEVSPDRKLPLSIFFAEYTQSVSAKVLAESKEIYKQGRVGALDDFSTFSESTKVYKKMRIVEKDLREKDKQRAKRKSERKGRKRANKEATSLFFFSISPLCLTGIREKVIREAEDKERERRMRKRKKKGRKRANKEDTSLYPPRFLPVFFYSSPPSLLEADLDETYLREEDKIREKIIRNKKKKEKRKAERKVFLIEKEKVKGTEEADMRIKKNKKREKQYTKKRRKRGGKQLRKPLCPSPLFPISPSPSPPLSLPMFCSSPPPLPLTPPPVSLCSFPPSLPPLSLKLPFGPVVFLHDQNCMVLSKNYPKIRQNQDLDATTSKQKLSTQSQDAGFGKSEGGLTKSVSQIIPNNGIGKQTISKPLTTTTLLGEKRRPGLTTAKKTDCITRTKIEISENGSTGSMTETANRCQSQVEYFKVSHTQKPLKELAISDGSFTKQKAASKVAQNKLSAQHSTGEYMVQRLDVGFNSECGGQSRLDKEASLKETGKVQEERETTLRVVREKETVLTLKEREKSESFISEERIGREKIQNQRKATLSKMRVQQAALREEKKKREAAISEEEAGSEKESSVKGKEEESKAAMSEKKRVKRKKEQDKYEVQMEGGVAVCEKEQVEKEKQTTLNSKGNGKVKSEKADLMQDNTKREMQNRKSSDKEKERDKKGVGLGATNSEQELPAQSGITGPETSKGNQIRSVLSVSQFLPANGKHQAAIKPLEDEGKKSLTTSTGNPNVSDESKVTGTETQAKNKNGSSKSMTTTVNRCQSEVEVLEVSHTKELLKETAVSDISSTKHKAASGIAPNKITAQRSTGEHMPEFLVSFISECGRQTRPVTLMNEAPLKKKDKMQEEKETALTEETVEIEKKEATLKGNAKVKTEEDLIKEDMKREKRKRRKKKKAKEREKKEVALAATNSEQEPPDHSGIAECEGRLVASVSQIVPTNSEQTVSDPLTVPKGTHLCKHQEKRSHAAATGNPSIPDESKKTGPETKMIIEMSKQDSTKAMTESANRCQSGVEVSNPLKEMTVRDSSSTKQKVASKVFRITAQPGTGEHMAQFLLDFINERGGQTRLATLRRVALPQYQEKYHWHYTHLSRGSLRKYDCFEISEDSSGVCHVRVVGAQRQLLGNTEPEKMECKTKKSLFYKPVCDIKMRNTSEHTRALEGDFHSVPGSSEHIVQYLYSYLSTHFFPYGCPVSSLDALYQNEYKSKFSHSQVEMINADFLKEFSNHFVLEVGRTFVKLKEGVDHSDTSQLKGCPYTPQHVNDYFRRYLAQEGVVCTQQLRVLFSECYMKEFKMPQKPIIHFIREDFFKRSSHLFVTFADIVVFRK